MKRKAYIGLLLTAMLAFQIWVGYLMSHYPYLGIIVDRNEGGEWVVKSLDTGSGSSNLDLQAGDVVRAVDGSNPGEKFTVVRKRTIEQAHLLGVVRDGKEFLVSTDRISKLSTYEIPVLISEIICFLISALLYYKIRNSSSSRYLSVVFLVFGIIFMSLEASLRSDELGSYVINIAMMLAPIVFLHFLIVFFDEKCKIRLTFRFMKYLYGFSFVYALAGLLDFFPSTYAVFAPYTQGSMTLAFFIVGVCIIFYYLSKIYIKYRNEYSYTSTIIKTVWVSLFISFMPIIIFSFVPQIMGLNFWVSPAFTTWMVLFFPLSFAYLIMTKQLYDIHMVLRRITYTLSLSIVPSAVLVGIDAVVFMDQASLKNLIVAYVITVILLSFILYSFEYFTTIFEPIIFPRKHFLQKALKKIAKNLGSISSFRELKDIILVDIVNTLQVQGGAVVFKYRDTTEIIHEGEIDTEELKRITSSDTADFAEYTGFEINRQEEYTSYLILTRKKTNTYLGLEEIQWLNLIITYLAVSMENLFLIRKLTTRLQQLAAQIPDEQVARELMWFRKLMFELQENERVRIATDLHDTTMQDLFFLKRRLGKLLEKYAFSKEDAEQMRSLIEYIEIINMNLRQSCFELHPHLLSEIGLVRTVRKLIDQESVLCDFEIEFNVGGMYVVEQWDMEMKTHVFRIIQELLNNARKHSNASKVKVTLMEIGHTLHIDYEDDGVGFEPEDAAANEVGPSGMGMEQIKSRILYLSGNWDLASSRGSGVRFQIHIPLNKEMTA